MSQPTISPTGYWDGKDAHRFHGYSKALVFWITGYLEIQKNKRIHDFGCGIGQYMRELAQLGFTDLVGYEGSRPLEAVFEPILEQDLTQRFDVEKLGNVLCLEVMEHIPAEHQAMVLDNIARACDGRLVMSWAAPGQTGHGHVNERTMKEAIELVVDNGFIFHQWATELARSMIPEEFDMDGAKLPWFKNTLLVFSRSK